MKILVLQLARIGDIYMSWPALRALRRAHPLAEIHLLVRPRFAAAADGLTAIQKLIKLPTTEVLSPLLQSEMDINGAFAQLSTFADELHAEKYDWIINLSFSPLSSYLTHYVTHPQTRVCGYTRFSDGYLSIPDDVSAYFYAQVGVQRPNRLHLIEIFANLVGQDLTPEDWRGPHPFPSTNKVLPRDYFVVHIGASEVKKSLSAVKWGEILFALRSKNQTPVVLIGAPDELPLSLQIIQEIGEANVHNFVGKTELRELFPILKAARLLVGCDSAPLHIANFTNTPVVNISLATVNHWETGPRTLESIVVRSPTERELDPNNVATIIHRSLIGEKQDLGVIHVIPGTPSYWAVNSRIDDFDWLFLRALYMSEDFPACEEPNFFEGIRRMQEINNLMIEQMNDVDRSGDIARVAPFIQRGEEIIETIGKLMPALQSLVRWYQTEKIRIPPGEMRAVLGKTLEIHSLMQKVLELYWRENASAIVAKELP